MSRPAAWLLVALLAAPAVAYLFYRLAKDLGFLDPPMNRQHELRRTILVSLFAFLLFLPVGIYGFEKGWPRIWILFGIVDGLAILFFAAGGVWAALQLWRLRHPRVKLPEIAPSPEGSDEPVELEIDGEGTEPEVFGPEP